MTRVTTTAPALETRRDMGVDLARGVAVLGMFVAHTAPSAGPGGVLQLSEYFPFPLFALLMGAGAALVARRMALPRHALESVVRGVLLIALGWALAQAGAQVAVVLGPLGVFAVLAWLVARAPAWSLWTAVALGVLLSPWSVRVGDEARIQTMVGASEVPLGLLDVVASRYYPLPMIFAAAALGVLFVRVFLPQDGPVPGARDRLVAAVACLGLSGVVLVAARAGVVEASASETTWLSVGVSILMALGVALLCLWWAEAMPRVTLPLAKVGAMAFTVYALHLLWLALWVRVLTDSGHDNTWVNVVGMSVAAVVIALAWHSFRPPGRWWRGPLEGLVGTLCATAGRLGERRLA